MFVARAFSSANCGSTAVLFTAERPAMHRQDSHIELLFDQRCPLQEPRMGLVNYRSFKASERDIASGHLLYNYLVLDYGKYYISYNSAAR